jgi:hypothetical protein
MPIFPLSVQRSVVSRFPGELVFKHIVHWPLGVRCETVKLGLGVFLAGLADFCPLARSRRILELGAGLALGRRRFTSLRHDDLAMRLMKLVKKKLLGFF